MNSVPANRSQQMLDLGQTPRRPVLRWHGGKWMIAKWIISHFPPHKIYVEPFGGAASVLMRKPRSFSEVYNDLDNKLVNLFRILRDPDKSARLTEILRLTPWSRVEFKDAYEECDDEIEIARRTIVRAFMGFGTTGLTRNGTGFRGRAERDNSTGVKDWENYPDSLKVFLARLSGVIIENLPALDVIKKNDSRETLIYLDPPYPHAARSGIKYGQDSGRCYSHEMTDSDHRQLAEHLHHVSSMVVISGYHCDLYRDLYADWKFVEKAALADGAKKRTEVLWLNPATEAARQKAKFALAASN